jgi:hypothetical protein
MEQITLLQWAGILLGSILIINSLFLLISLQYFSFLDKNFFIESITPKQKEKFENSIKRNGGIDRLITTATSFGLGTIIILWSLQIIESVTPPFFILAAILLVLRYLYLKR